MIIRAIRILLIVFLFNSCSEKGKNTEIEDFIVNQSEVEFWDVYGRNDFGESVNRLTYSFYENGRAEIYTIGITRGERFAQYTDRPHWKMINDSVIDMFCYEKYKIVSFGGDSIVLRKLDNPGIYLVYVLKRAIGNWNINEASMKRRDSMKVALKNSPNPCVIY